MKSVNQNFKNNIKKYGRQLDAKITIGNVVIAKEDINSICPSFHASLFKTVMQGFEIDCNYYIPKDTIINVSIGVKFGSSQYEYIEYENFKVKSCEAQEDTESYKIIAYDKMMDSMVDFNLDVTYPITVRNYLIAIFKKLGWSTQGIPASFINSTKQIKSNIHDDIGYTFRDVLDEIATITGSFIYIKNDIPTLGYITETNETINEEYLSQDDVTIGEKYFINSLVFSRAEESDNVYRKDDDSIEGKGLHEFRIEDNQILSTNDRDDFIDELFNYLKTLEFYIYDVKSTGIMWLEICDQFTLDIHGSTYSTIILNNEITVDQDIEETLYVEEPDETETDYKCADSTDKRINQAYILVNKQKQEITSRVSSVETLANNAQEGVNNITNTQGEVEGKNIHIEDSAEEPFVGVELYGETSQKTRSGKNLYDNSQSSVMNNANRLTTLETGKRATNTAVSNWCYSAVLIPNPDNLLGKQVTISANISASANNLGALILYGLNSSNTVVYNFGSITASGSKTITLPSTYPTNVTKLALLFYSNTNGTAAVGDYVDYTNVQLEIGSAATDYEPYGVMPSPDYPSEIENVEGKNILDVKAMLDYWGATYTYNESTNSYNITNIGSGYANPYQFAREDILVSLSGDLSFEIATGVRLNLMNSNNESVSTFYDSSTKNENVLASKIRINYNAWNNGNATITDFMIEEGTVATPYVPYNSLEFKVEGKNRFDLIADNIISLNDKTNFSIENNQLIINNTSGGYGIQTKILNLKPNTTYTVSCKPSWEIGKGTYWGWRLFNVDANSYSGYAYSDTLTFTTTDKTKYQLLYYLGVPNNNEGKVTLSDIQIEEGTVATPYEPYKSQVATFPLGEGQKLMEGSYTGEDGIHNARKQVIFDGSSDEDWHIWALNATNVERFYINLTHSTNSPANTLCSHFNFQNNNLDEEHFRWSSSSLGYNQFMIYINKTRLSDVTVAGIKGYLQANPITVEYELAEEEITPYTNEQRTALEDFARLTTYKNITNITSDAYAKVTYMRDNGLDVYETKQNAQKKYTETSEKLTEQKMTVDGVITQVSDITSKTDELTGEVKTINSEISTVKQTIEGWSSELKNTGGNNIFYYSLDFWDNSNGLEEYSDTEIIQNSISQSGYVLNNGSAKQTQSVKNGFYTCSFNYKKLLELAVCQVKINGITYDLTEIDWAEFEQAFEVKTNKIEIEFIGDTDSSLCISDLMVNVGKTKLSWSQNANETRTDTVTIGKGIQVNSSAKNTYHRIDADGNRTFNKATGKVVNEATDKGTETEELVVRGQAKITGLLIQKVSDQVWINSLL